MLITYKNCIQKIIKKIVLNIHVRDTGMDANCIYKWSKHKACMTWLNCFCCEITFNKKVISQQKRLSHVMSYAMP